MVVIFAFEYYFLKPRSEMLRDSIRVQFDIFQKYEDLIKNAGITEEKIKSAVDDMKKIEDEMIQEKSELLASAKLQGKISGITKKTGLRVMTIRPLSPVKHKNYISIPIYFEGNGNIKQFGDFLKYIEASSLRIKIDKLDLNITNLQKPKDLKFKIQVSGLNKI
jgi:Tfp pilus assembly protein PilO